MTKDISTLLADVDRLLTEGVDLSTVPPDALETFKNGIADLVMEAIKAKPTDVEPIAPYLRPSNIGTKDRKLWFILNSPAKAQTYDADKLRSFLFGNLIEHLCLFLAKVAGHTVTDEQKEVTFNGITGKKDAKIDGINIDVKSASPYSFPKFATGEMLDRKNPEADPFGYVEQLSLYDEADRQEGNESLGAGWWAVDKSSGKQSLLFLDEFTKPREFNKLVDHKKGIKERTSPPEEMCFPDVPQSKTSPNMMVSKACTFCAFLAPCRGDKIRTFMYSNGPVHLTKVVNTPSVPELETKCQKKQE